MATLAFLLLKLAGRVDSPYDIYACSLLLALDCQTGFRLWVYLRSRR